MKVVKSLGLGLVCAMASTSALAQAQPKQFVHVLSVQATPSGALDYEAFVKKVMAAADKIGQDQRVVTFQVTSGGPGYTYMIATYFDKWAETESALSAPETLMKALGDVEGARVLRVGRTSIASTESAVYRLLPNLSTKPKAYDPPPAHLQVIRNYVKPGMAREWEQVIGRYKAASEQVAEAPTAIRRVSVQGPANVYITSMAYTQAGERDAWPTFMDILKKAYGEEEARSLDGRRAACIERAESFVLKFRPDLSRLGK
jgi:hypothetical protein